jgi:hypothetical protein
MVVAALLLLVHTLAYVRMYVYHLYSTAQHNRKTYNELRY